MRIRTAKDADVDALVGMIYSEGYEVKGDASGMVFVIEDLRRSVQYTIEHPEVGTLLVADIGGEVAGYIWGEYAVGWIGNFGYVTWQELSWYVNPKYRGNKIGLALMDELENVLRAEKRVDRIIMGHGPVGKNWKVRKHFLSRGYHPLQMQYIKQIKES